MLILGVDGGGSKTVLRLCDRTGDTLALAQTGTLDYVQTGFQPLGERLLSGIAELFSQAGADLDDLFCAAVGIPRYGEIPADTATLTQIVQEALSGCDKVYAVNDVTCAMFGALAGQAGICILCGTGSMAMGLDVDGHIVRCGGWSHLFSDQGSGYWLGCQTMALFAKQADGVIPRGALYDDVLARWKPESPMDMIPVFERMLRDRKETADLQRILLHAAEQGDASAAALYEQAASELAALAVGIRSQLHLPETGRRSVALTGGLRGAGPFLLEPLGAALQAHDIQLTAPILSPDAGAVLYAAVHAGMEDIPTIISALSRG